MLQVRELAPENPFEAQQGKAQAGAATAVNGAAAAQTDSAQPDGRSSQMASKAPQGTSARTLSSHSSVGAAPPPWPSPPRPRPTPAAQGTTIGRPHSESPAVSAQFVDGMAPHPVMQHVKQLAAKAAKEVKDGNTGDPVAWKRHGITDGRQSSVLSDSASSDGTQS